VAQQNTQSAIRAEEDAAHNRLSVLLALRHGGLSPTTGYTTLSPLAAIDIMALTPPRLAWTLGCWRCDLLRAPWPNPTASPSHRLRSKGTHRPSPIIYKGPSSGGPMDGKRGGEEEKRGVRASKKQANVTSRLTAAFVVHSCQAALRVGRVSG
jgi:hypothetical protein